MNTGWVPASEKSTKELSGMVDVKSSTDPVRCTKRSPLTREGLGVEGSADMPIAGHHAYLL